MTKTYVGVWLALVAIAAAQVSLALAHLPGATLVASLLALAVLEAGIALRYFMHLKYEPPALFWTLIPALVFALLMLNQIWADAARLRALRFP
jgi:heme/copper-type cytochrome/quinol oxidase subunit 4